MAQINQPQARPKATALDVFGRALEAVQTIQGIKQKSDAADAQQRGMEDAANGILDVGAQAKAVEGGAKIAVTDPGVPGALPFIDKSTGQHRWVIPKSTEKDFNPVQVTGYKIKGSPTDEPIYRTEGSPDYTDIAGNVVIPDRIRPPVDASKNNNKFDTQLKDWQNKMDPDVGRKGNIGSLSLRGQAADRVIQFINDNPNPTPQQLASIAEDLQQVYTNGSGGSESRIKSLLPETVATDAAKLKQYFLGHPEQTNTQEFVQLMKGQAQAQRDLVDRTIKDYHLRTITALDHANWAKDPEAQKAIADTALSYNITPQDIEDFRKNRGKIGGSKSGSGLVGNNNNVTFGAPGTNQPQKLGPQKGDVDGKYRFKGGNPADPTAWEKLQ